MKLGQSPNKNPVKTYITMIFGDAISENIIFALDINYQLKSASFVSINEQRASSYTRLKNE